MKTILSIDGGGIRGIIPAMILAEIERKTGKKTALNFDLIAGTSTGGILALGFGKKNKDGSPKYSAEQLGEIYVNNGKEIFSRSLWHGISSANGILDELYSSNGIETVLKRYFEDDVLENAYTKLLITSYDIEKRQPVFFKSWQPAYSDVLMRDVGRATSAAPTYFEPANIDIQGKTQSLIDGGVFINSPTVSAYVEATKQFADEKDFFVLSLGTGGLIRPIHFSEAKNWGKAGWLLPLLSCMFDGVAKAANYQMTELLGDKNYVRLDIELCKASDDMDNATNGNIENLKAEAKELILDKSSDIDRICEILINNSSPKLN